MNNKIINHRLWLGVFVIVSVWIVFSVELKIVPLIPSSLSNSFLLGFNRALLALAYSFLAAFIFYLITTVLPRKILIYRSKKILSKQVHWLLYELFVLINQILYSFKIGKSINEIEEKDLLCIDGDVSKNIKGYYSTGEYRKQICRKAKQFTGFGDMPFCFPDDVLKKLGEIPKLIKKIREANPNYHIDEAFAEILSSIETNKIIEWHGTGGNKMFLFANSSNELYNLIFDYNRLLKIKYHKLFRQSFHRIYFYTQEEIQNIPQKTASFFEELAPVKNKSMALNACIVYNPQYYDSKAIISKLNSGCIITANGTKKEFQLMDFSNGRIQTPDNSRCVIIIEEQISSIIIKEWVEANKGSRIIILLKSNIFTSSNKDKYKNKITGLDVYKVYYRKPISLLGLHLFTKYPTTLLSH